MSTWYRERLPAFAASSDAPELVLLHGWASNADIWRAWLPWLRRRANITLLDLPGSGRSPFQPGLSIDGLLEQLARYVPHRSALLGWSLGGMLAARFVARYPQQCAALITVATNACYVARADWPHAMSTADFEKFYAEVVANPAVSLRRFQTLQMVGDERERELLREMRRAQSPETSAEALRWGLDLLRELDVRNDLRACRVAGLHLFGARDVLVPVAASNPVAALIPEHWAVVIDGVAHLPFMSHPEICWQHVDRTLFDARLLKRAPASARRKEAVAQSFSRAAPTYDAVADMQRCVAARLQTCLPRRDGAVRETLLDIGCGTGAIAAQLAAAGDVIALDFAEGMTRYARNTHRDPAIVWVCGDAENLPLSVRSVDVVFSSLALQWSENLGAAFGEIARVLKPGGRAVIATLGPGTLAELRAAWAQADTHVHVNPFLPREDVEKALRHVDLTVADWSEENIVLEYLELRDLTRELKGLGAHNVNDGRPAGLTGRERMRAFQAAYEAQRNAAGKLPATYQVWYLTLEKPLG